MMFDVEEVEVVNFDADGNESTNHRRTVSNMNYDLYFECYDKENAFKLKEFLNKTIHTD